MGTIDLDELLRILPRLIRENDTIKGAIITALSGVVATREDIQNLMREMDTRFEAMDKRFEALQQQMDTRFEAMDKRFEALQQQMNTRFEAMDTRFEAMQQQMNTRFEAMDTRFEALQQQMDTRFEALQQQLDTRFEAMDTRFEAGDRRFERIEKELVDIKRQGLTTLVELRTLSGRSGADLEEMVRELLRDTISSHGIDLRTITRKSLFDKDGTVFSPGYATDVDVVVENGETHLYEVKYRVDQRDAYHFTQVARLYKVIHGIKPVRLVMIVLEISAATLATISSFREPIDVIVGKVVP